MRLAPSRAISSSVSVISPACTEEVSVDSLSMGGVSFPPPASGVFVCWAHAEGYAALFHPIKSRDPQLLRIPPARLPDPGGVCRLLCGGQRGLCALRRSGLQPPPHGGQGDQPQPGTP